MTNRQAQEERLAVLRTQACQADACAGEDALAARAGYSPATMKGYVGEMARGHGAGRVLDAAASEPGAVVWRALRPGGAGEEEEEEEEEKDDGRAIEAALRRPVAEIQKLAPAERDLVTEQAAFAHALAALADWQRCRKALYAARRDALFRYVLDDDQLLDLWACLDLQQLRDALPALRLVDQQPPDARSDESMGDALAGLRIQDSSSPDTPMTDA